MKYRPLACQADHQTCVDDSSVFEDHPNECEPERELALELTASIARPQSVQQSSAPSALQSLPEHILHQILDELPPDALLNTYQVCKSWRQLIQQDSYQCKRLAWNHQSFMEPGHVRDFRPKRRLISYTAERRLQHLADCVGKTMLLQFHTL